MNMGLKTLSSKDFKRLSSFIQSEYGIKLPISKKVMLESRLQKRLRKLELNSFSEYCNYIFSDEGAKEEVSNMMDEVTTNKTEFFREPDHFEFLKNTAIPELVNDYKLSLMKPLKLWSAGCSSGEEPYTLAIVLSEYKEKHSGFSFNIKASDLSEKILNKAKTAIYDKDKISEISPLYKKKYFLRSKSSKDRKIRIKPILRSLIFYDKINLITSNYSHIKRQHIIFCRNVLIYFNRETQEKIIEKFTNLLYKGGFLFLGHSETICSMNVPLKAIAPTTYRKI